ncbi:hypothetical protein CPLU01_05043 [Colletotrichum plurivorum]|uniref:Uncharacterized protein n=1 Tax=Colletotrichum plurivorum TaxID=2175906 RepID=A0A8H6KMG3_9PEZI|nr:hypothetical protein CPLU01_05043 [Colletotrichum plurivorum]
MTRITPTQIAENLRQTESASKRSSAITDFGKALRRADRFRPTWNALGGAPGIARLLAEFSVQDVRWACRVLGRTASSENVRDERRAEITKLVRLIYDDDNPLDERPLRRFYQDIVPACGLDVVEEWEARGVEWNHFQLKGLSFGHRERRERKFLQAVFAPDNEKEVRFKDEKAAFGGNVPLCEEILLDLLARDAGKARIPPDFMDEFAMRLLKRLLRKRYDGDGSRDRILGHVVDCVWKHKEVLADQLYLWQGSLIQYIIQRWNKEDFSEAMEQHLVRLLEIYPSRKRKIDLMAIYNIVIIPRKMNPEARYRLLRLAVRHLQGFGIDIEDGSEAAIAELRKLTARHGPWPAKQDLWPAELFLKIDGAKSWGLFEKLVKAYPAGDFVSFVISSGSILRQTRAPDDGRHGDIEVIRLVLVRRSGDEAAITSCLGRARLVVEERRQKAQQSRDPQVRAFWAKSAMSLSVAARDLELVRETVLWARRFGKDSLTTRDLYAADTMDTKEIKSLLGAIPWINSPGVTLASVKKDVELANLILLDLIESAIAVSREPGFDQWRCHSLLGLPKRVTVQRSTEESMKTLGKIVDSCMPEDAGLDISNALWKPTLDNLLEIDALLGKPEASALRHSSPVTEVYAANALMNFLHKSPAVTADLAGFLMERMAFHFGPKKLGALMRHVVQVAAQVAKSDQPELACPLIRDLVLNGDENSSWHRQIINVRFLKSLPATSAREFMQTMADGVRDRMREQNSRPARTNEAEADNEAPRPPVIKVTTIKMMAQLLEDNQFLDGRSSCDILVTLLAEARHIDARIAIINSLLGTLKTAQCPEALRDRILNALEEYVLPSIGWLSERRPLSEDDWVAAADEGAKLPEVGSESPILDLLLSEGKESKLDSVSKARIAKIISGGLAQSIFANRRWLTLFLAKNNFALDMQDRLPVGPVSSKALVSFFKNWTEYMPAALFEVLRDTALASIHPSPEVVRVTEAVKANPDLLDSDAGKHWLRQYNGLYYQSGFLDAAPILVRPTKEMGLKAEGAGGVTVRMVQEFLILGAKEFVLGGQDGRLEGFVRGAFRPRFERAEQWRSWRSNCVPVVKEIIAWIESLRRDDGEGLTSTEGAERRPILPNTLHLRVSILPIPHSSPKQPASAEDVGVFISELSDLVDRLATRKSPYHADFALLKTVLLEARCKADFALFAVRLSRLVNLQEPGLADYLRLELASDLLAGSDEPAKDVVPEARDAVSEWTKCEDEGLRAIGVVVERKMEGKGKDHWFVRD